MKKGEALNGSVIRCSLLSAGFFAAAFFVSFRLPGCGVWGALLLSSCLTVFAGLFLLISRREFGGFFLPVSAAVCLLLLLRLCFFGVATSDYIDFLKPWTERFRELGGLAGLKYAVGNYNVPYLFFLAVFSYFEFDTLYLIKLLSVLFDLLLAFALMKTLSAFTESHVKKSLCFASALALPTVFINGSVWGQCDSIYASLAVLALWLCLDSKPALSMAAAALSFAFKLQAVFVMPVFLLFLFSGRLRLRHLPVFPAVYLLAVSPALLAGRGFRDTVSVYISTAGTAGSALNYNSPSMYSLPYFFNSGDTSAAAAAGIAAAAALCLIVFAAFFIRRRKIGRRSLFFAALLFSVSIPLLLPHMHDRYFYLCDALALAAAFIEPACLLLPLFSQFASLLGYHAYFYMRYLLPMRCGFALLVILALTAAFFAAAALFGDKADGGGEG